jgi:hypothetical protein
MDDRLAFKGQKNRWLWPTVGDVLCCDLLKNLHSWNSIKKIYYLVYYHESSVHGLDDTITILCTDFRCRHFIIIAYLILAVFASTSFLIWKEPERVLLQ